MKLSFTKNLETSNFSQLPPKTFTSPIKTMFKIRVKYSIMHCYLQFLEPPFFCFPSLWAKISLPKPPNVRDKYMTNILKLLFSLFFSQPVTYLEFFWGRPAHTSHQTHKGAKRRNDWHRAERIPNSCLQIV